jgi:hypothetical protein
MSTTVIKELTTLDTVSCYRCGVLFALPTSLMRRLLDTGATFYCPSGHPQHFTDTTEDRLRRAERLLELSRASRRAAQDQADAAERSNRALRGANTKLRKRVAAGVCPCCSRTFQDLARHMAGQHPNYAESEPAES